MTVARGKRPLQLNKRRLVSTLCVLGLGLYLVVSLVVSQVEIMVKKQELAALDERVAQQQETNTELERLMSAGDGVDYIERVARERLNYASPDERVYIDMSGK